jgi:hypothetical protein
MEGSYEIENKYSSLKKCREISAWLHDWRLLDKWFSFMELFTWWGCRSGSIVYFPAVKQYILTHKLSLIKSEQSDINGYTKNNTAFYFPRLWNIFLPWEGRKT